MQSVVRWGIVGGGKVVESKSGPGFCIPGQSCVSAVTRRDIDDARRTAAFLSAPYAYASVEQMLLSGKVDAVYVATPPGLHFEHALSCLEAGIPVYVEKPFTTSYNHAKQLVAYSERIGVPVFVAQYRRAIERFRYVRSLIAGDLGAPLEFDFRLSRKLEDDISHPWLYDKGLSGGGKFADIAPHSIDIFTFFFGRATYIGATARHVRSPNQREDLVAIALRFDSGVLGTANYNFVSQEKDDLLTIECERGTVRMSVHGNRDVEVSHRDGRHDVWALPLPSIVEAPMIGEVVSSLRGVGGNPCFGKDALETTRIIEQVLMTLK